MGCPTLWREGRLVFCKTWWLHFLSLQWLENQLAVWPRTPHNCKRYRANCKRYPLPIAEYIAEHRSMHKNCTSISGRFNYLVEGELLQVVLGNETLILLYVTFGSYNYWAFHSCSSTKASFPLLPDVQLFLLGENLSLNW